MADWIAWLQPFVFTHRHPPINFLPESWTKMDKIERKKRYWRVRMAL